MRPGLVIGAPHVVRYTVPMHQTVPNLLPDLPEFRRGQRVFATGFMVGLMEAPCMAAVYPHLEPGEVTVGTLINMTHLAATMPGTSLVAEARAIAVDGQTVRFAVVVTDPGCDVVAVGEHGLRVVKAARFRDRLDAKQAQLRRLGSSPLPCERHRAVPVMARSLSQSGQSSPHGPDRLLPWNPSRDGPRLTGSHLPARDLADAGGTP